MNELSSLGLILLFALLAGHIVKFIRVPEVTGYILAGVVVGPSVLGWISHDNLAALSVFSEVALGLILFSIGAVFELDRVKSVGPAILRVTLTESFLAAFLVSVTMLLFGQRWEVAILLGTISMATAPASTLMVLRERNAAGPLTETVTGIIGINNIVCLTAFLLVATSIDLTAAFSGEGVSVWGTLYRSIYPLVWQLVGSVALGFLVGVMLASWAPNVHEHGEMLILLTGSVLLCVGAAILLDLSTLVASLAVGATLTNLSASTRRAFSALARSDPPFYAIFFVLAGAELDVTLVASLGILGIIYVLARATGKIIGATVGAQRSGYGPQVQRLLGLTLMSQAGLAIGLTLSVDRRYPEFAAAVTTVILAAVTISEVIGPIATRIAIDRSGESRAPEIEPAGAGD